MDLLSVPLIINPVLLSDVQDHQHHHQQQQQQQTSQTTVKYLLQVYHKMDFN